MTEAEEKEMRALQTILDHYESRPGNPGQRQAYAIARAIARDARRERHRRNTVLMAIGAIAAGILLLSALELGLAALVAVPGMAVLAAPVLLNNSHNRRYERCNTRLI